MSERVTLITGAGRGIGRAVAVELGRLGDRLMLVARTESELRETASLARNSEICIADIAKPQAVNDAVQKCVERFGTLDAVVHCAGVAPALAVNETSDRQWHDVIDTNLSAAFYLARAAWPIFSQRKAGVIVNISSAAAREPFDGFAAYASAKAGLNMLGLVLAKEGAKLGIRAHTIAPGATETAMFRKLLSPEQFPEGDALSPADVARIVAQCIAGDLRYTSGEVIWVHKTV